MTDNQITIEVAKLDGFNYTGIYLFKHGRLTRPGQFLCLTSRDAIIPVIEKQGETIKFHIIHYLHEQVNIVCEDSWCTNDIVSMLCTTPKQLSIALLKATGKWTEE